MLKQVQISQLVRIGPRLMAYLGREGFILNIEQDWKSELEQIVETFHIEPNWQWPFWVELGILAAFNSKYWNILNI